MTLGTPLSMACSAGFRNRPDEGHAGLTVKYANSGLLPSTFFRGANGEVTTIPKAYINYILLDEQFKYVSGDGSRVRQHGVVTDHWMADDKLKDIAVEKNGYIFVYASNESNVDVFFDNLQVVHKPGPILEESHYYPFGLTMAGISSKALQFGGPENKYKFNDGTELNTDFNINLYETTYRGLDPQIGRFWQIDPLADISHQFSPYAYANNNPVSLNDPSGLLAEDPDTDDNRPRVTKESFLREVVVKGKYPKGLDAENGQVYEPRSKFWDWFEGERTWKGYTYFDGSNGKSTSWPVKYKVDYRGYLTGEIDPTIKLAFNAPIGTSPINLKAVFRLKNFLKGEYDIYTGIKNGLPYIGKARGGIKFRYTAKQIRQMEITVIEGLEKLPNNATALGVEQLIIELNGGAGVGKLANINNATIKEIYINTARHWLDANMPNWETLLKFQ